MAHTSLTTGVIRKLWSAERARLRDHLLRLDGDCRRNRFGMAASDAFVTDYAGRCFGMSDLVYGFVEAGVVRGAAELRALTIGGERAAEVAFSVEMGWRNRSIGTEFFGRLVTAARNRGYRRMYMSCLAWNRPMQALAAKYAAELSFEPGETMGVIGPARRTAISLLDEAAHDAAAFTTAMLDLQAREVRAWSRVERR